MRRYLLHLFFLLFFCIRCYDDLPEAVDLPTRLCVKTYHHFQPIPDARVFIKFNADTFPGYGQPETYFDKTFKTGKDAKGCLEPLPEGTHWLIAFGYDSLYFPHDVFGSMQVVIDLQASPKVDTILYVSE